MDVFIPVGGVQNNDYRELRFCLRAIERHMRDLGRVFLAGRLPDWLRDVEILDVEDVPDNPNESVQRKLLALCGDDRVTADFIFSHDDIYPVQDFRGEELPFYATSEGPSGMYQPRHFAVHTPVRYRREMYRQLFENAKGVPVPSPRNFYCNFFRAEGKKIEEVVLRIGEGARAPAEQIARAPFFTLNDRAAGKAECVAFLESLYPVPSRFESA